MTATVVRKGARMRFEDDDPTGWRAAERLIGCIGGGPKRKWWGEIGEDLEVQVSSEGIVLSKGYREHGHGLDHPWLALSTDEFRALLANGEAILRAIDEAAAEPDGE
jgi:hypothetical protein